MKKYLIMLLVALLLLTGGVSVIAVKLCTAEYSPNIYVTVENKVGSENASSHRHDNTSESKVESTAYTYSHEKSRKCIREQ